MKDDDFDDQRPAFGDTELGSYLGGAAVIFATGLAIALIVLAAAFHN